LARLDLARQRSLGMLPDLGVERPRRGIQQLLLPRVNLVRMNLASLRHTVRRRLLAQRL
jgi:hypothetical protein